MLAAASVAQLGLAANPACASFGWGYDDLNVQRVNGAFVADAATCQASCAAMVFCDTFTFYSDTGGCWLQGNNVTKITHKDAISGPKVCPEGSTATGATTVVTDSTPEAAAKGGFPWWGWVLIGLGVAGAGAAVACYFCSSESKKRKGSRRGIKVADPEEAGDAEALVEAQEVPTYAGSQYYTATPAAPYYAAAPAPAPAYYTAPPVYMAAAPTQYVSYATGHGNLFEQLDVDGDGVLSREELAAMGQ